MSLPNAFHRRHSLRHILVAAWVVVSVLAHAETIQHPKKPAVAKAPQARASRPIGADEVRALWVTRTSLVSPAAITRMVRAARGAGFNTLLVQVRARGDAYYANGLEPRAEALAAQPATFDPLAFTLAEAKREGLGVHAWVNLNLVSSAADLPTAPAHVVNRHPEWLMVPRAQAKDLRVLNPRSPLYLDKLAHSLRQQAADVEGLYLSPIHPDAASFVVSVVRDIATRYPVDGVHLDYARYPTDEFDYSQSALSQFAQDVARDLPASQAETLRGRERANLFAWTEAFPERWRDFRRARLTTLVERVRAVVKQARPTAVVSAAVVPDAVDAFDRRMQDWRGWLQDGLLDVVCPMAYATDLDTFNAQLSTARQAAGSRPVWIGIGAYRLSPEETIDSIRAARRTGVAGVILFSYDSLAAAPPPNQPLSLIGRFLLERGGTR